MGAVRRTSAESGGRGLTSGWLVTRRRAAPAELVSEDPAPCRSVVVKEPTSAAIVLGSTQPMGDFDEAECAAQGIGIVRRRSGGGAVLVRPGGQIWVDLFVPRSDPLFDEDVVASFAFVGRAWMEALQGGGAGDLEVAPAMAGTPWSKILCFAGLGPGEVTLGGRKVVGVSQRRDRDGAWFFSMAPIRPVDGLSEFLADERSRREAYDWLATYAGTVPVGDGPAAGLADGITDRLIQNLP